MLEVQGVSVFYSKVQALFQVSLEVGEREIVAIVGPNGAGKTTLMKTISGLLRPAEGHLVYQGREIQGRAPQWIVRQGIVHCPEGRRLFPGLTVLENIQLGTAAWPKRPPVEIKVELETIYHFFPRLAERRKQLAWSLSGGEQQMVAIARGLMGRPKLFILDEPSLGLAPNLVEEVFEIIGAINREKGIPVLLVEQNANMALQLANRAYVLETGRIVLGGEARQLARNPDVVRSYLGGRSA
jgi:branched-chain amino acid transport system ATP-binding protein